MSESRFRFEPLGKQHDRAAFSCGVDALDHYLQRQARQDVDRRLGIVRIMFDPDAALMAGYYSMSGTGLEPAELPDDLRRKLPNYPRLPALLIGRLALDRRYRGQGLGEILLLNALGYARDMSTRIGGIAVVVDAKDEHAARFYERFGFRRFDHDEQRLFIPIQSLSTI